MEKLAIIVEATGERFTCMLNPEHIVISRSAGLGQRRTTAGLIAGPHQSDFPLMRTGGGRTEVELQLLFDVDLVPPPILATATPTPPAEPGEEELGSSSSPQAPPTATPRPPRDVRDYTRPLWELAENSDVSGWGVPEVRLVLGKTMNILAVVEAVAERFERFDANGVPGRSWMSLRLVRVPDANPPAPTETESVDIPSGEEALARAAAAPLALHQVVGAGSAPGEPATGGETLAAIAARYFDGRAALWRWIADVNQLDDVVWPEPGRELIIPPPPAELSHGASP